MSGISHFDPQFPIATTKFMQPRTTHTVHVTMILTKLTHILQTSFFLKDHSSDGITRVLKEKLARP